ncbi:hypothetical protein Nepgr_006131 [Nepenthes gracilis]|uniref:3-beta hydroxysteroid dehydrogenase/isomerase domain-containing protein n=1 Tax=Nepenthes gracilis TaxID=150966 RepID=A0AAD3S526_NEPGR|nr:hypothetical protein Nepgr_006131 [Nepenthes gracilis]
MVESYEREVLMLSKPQVETVYGEDQRRRVGESLLRSLSARQRKLVCVTSGNSYFGAHLIKELCRHGYCIRATVQNQGDFEDMKRLLSNEEMNQLESVVVAKMGDLENLCHSFIGCHVIFHTSSFLDPHGVSGYTERTAFLETVGSRNVIEACGRAAYAKRCILTSSLLASIWQPHNFDRVLDENSWSDEDFCRENKLWLALGKTRAEKAAWVKSKEMKVKLVTVCPGLVMAPSFPALHHETSLPYLKGGRTMMQRGVLATEDVGRLAKAHVQVYEAMDYGACGRYFCFERTIKRLEEAIQLENGLKLPGLLSGGRNAAENDEEIIPSGLSNSKLTRLLHNASPPSSCRR